jgi:hypothetical protein
MGHPLGTCVRRKCLSIYTLLNPTLNTDLDKSNLMLIAKVYLVFLFASEIGNKS